MKNLLLEGKFVKFYNLGMYFSGLFFVHKKVLSLIELKKGNSLLDVGCGTGTIPQKLNEKFGANVKLFAIDPSPEMLAIARSKDKKGDISFKIAYGNDLPFVNNYLDWTISVLSFHHMPPEEKNKTVREMARVLKPGGKLLISDFGRPRGFFGKIFYKISKRHGYSEGNMELIEKALSENNLKIIKTARTWGWIEHFLAIKL